MLRKILKILLVIALIPFVYSFSSSFYYELGHLNLHSKNQSLFIVGLVAYLGLHAAIYKPKYLYILGHELTHAVAVWILGGKVFGIKVSSKGGSVHTDRSSFFVSLAPYLFPFYTIVISLAYLLSSLFLNLSHLAPYFLFTVGFTLSFHIVMTVEFLKIKQPDIIKSGYVFSMLFIYIVNLNLLAVILSWVFSGFSLETFYTASINTGINFYQSIFMQLFLN